MRYFLELSYDGTSYSGWQRQNVETTVQGQIEKALTTLLRKETPIVGCGRTDKGVHATHYIAHLDIDEDQALASQDILYKLNRILDKDIACHRLIKMHDNAHARYDAQARTYNYHIHLEKSPFLGLYSTFLRNKKNLSIQALHEVAEFILQQTDFTSFCKMHGSDTGTNCSMYESNWVISDDQQRLMYQIKANRFLRGMVRLIVGSTLNVASGKLPLVELKSQVSNKTRSPLMQSAPPQGLALVKIDYPYSIK